LCNSKSVGWCLWRKFLGCSSGRGFSIFFGQSIWAWVFLCPGPGCGGGFLVLWLFCHIGLEWDFVLVGLGGKFFCCVGGFFWFVGYVWCGVWGFFLCDRCVRSLRELPWLFY